MHACLWSEEREEPESRFYPLITGNFSLVLKSQCRVILPVVRSVIPVCERQYLNLVNKDYLVVLKEHLQ